MIDDPVRAIMTRSALEAWGHNPPRNIARVEVLSSGRRRIVTIDDQRQERREWHARRAQQRDALVPIRAEPYRVSVAYFDMDLFGGWQAFIDSLHNRAWIDRDRRWLKSDLMSLFPLVLPIGDEWERWESWKREFARRYRRRAQDGQPVGVRMVWWDGRNTPQLSAPNGGL